MICVIATMETAAGRRGDLLEILRPFLPQIRAEQGCIEYEVMVDTKSGAAEQELMRSNAVVFVEKWESLEVWQKHLKAVHVAEFFRLADELQITMQLQVLEPA